MVLSTIMEDAKVYKSQPKRNSKAKCKKQQKQLSWDYKSRKDYIPTDTETNQ